MVISSRRLSFCIACAFVLACGGQSRAPTPEEGGAPNAAGQGGAGSVGGAGGAAGIIIVTSEPTPCITSDNKPGIMVDVFPFPGPVARCEAFAQPGALDASCPGDILFRCGFDDCLGIEQMSGCCRPSGDCGLLETGYFGAENALGCLDRQPWVDGASYLHRPVEPVTCNP